MPPMPKTSFYRSKTNGKTSWRTRGEIKGITVYELCYSYK